MENIKSENHFITDIKAIKPGSAPECSVIELLLRGAGKDEVLAMCRSKLRVLTDSDRKRHTEYIKTLRTYIECNNDLLCASKKLYVHRNTIVQRIKKINALLGTPINDPVITNEFWNIFRIMDFYGEK